MQTNVIVMILDYLTVILVHVEVVPISPTLDVGAQVQQVANVECKQIFMQAPLLKVNFR